MWWAGAVGDHLTCMLQCSKGPYYKMWYKSQVSPECVCEVLAQNTPWIIYYIILKMPILSGSRNTLFSCMSLYMQMSCCAPPTSPEQGCAFTAVPQILWYKHLLGLIIMSIVLKSCVLKPYQFKPLVFWAHTHRKRLSHGMWALN